jgi:hypothetical protein
MYDGSMSGSSEKILILDRGVVELAYPREWTVKANPSRYLELVDPTDSCKLEVSYLKMPSLGPDSPKVSDLLGHVLAGCPDVRAPEPITTQERGSLRLAWTTYTYEAQDTERGELRKAFGRWMIGSNGTIFVLFTYYYWADDASWAVPAWERMAGTLRVEGEVMPISRKAKWTLRDPGSSN